MTDGGTARAGVAVAGAAGRMGRMVLEQLLEARDLRLVGALEGPHHPELGSDAGALVGRPTGVRLTADASMALALADVVVDFSHPSGTESVLRAAMARGVGVVVGTTGLTEAASRALDEACRVVPVVAAPNMSVGVLVLGRLLREALRLLRDDADVEIIEIHHGRKTDAPSGTALRLAEIAADARGVAVADVIEHGRVGAVGARVPGNIGVHAVRGGDIVGDHTVLLASNGERIELVHRAHSRAVFAAGALRAARWVVGRAPGRYGIDDVIDVD